MHADLIDTATPIVVDFRAARAAAGKRAQLPDDGTDVAARIFMACLALLFLALAALALRSSFAGGPSVHKPRASRPYCSDLRWGMPFPYGKCFIVPDDRGASRGVKDDELRCASPTLPVHYFGHEAGAGCDGQGVRDVVRVAGGRGVGRPRGLGGGKVRYTQHEKVAALGDIHAGDAEGSRRIKNPPYGERGSAERK